MTEGEFDHVILVTKHPMQPEYMSLTKAVPQITFLNLKKEISEAALLRKVDNQQRTAVFFDDVIL